MSRRSCCCNSCNNCCYRNNCGYGGNCCGGFNNCGCGGFGGGCSPLIWLILLFGFC